MRFYSLKRKEDTKASGTWVRTVSGDAVGALKSADRKHGGLFGVGSRRAQGTFAEDRLMPGLRVQRDSVQPVLTWGAEGWVPGCFGDSHCSDDLGWSRPRSP